MDEDTDARAILATMDRAGVDELPVVARDGAFRGMVGRRAVERRLYDRHDEDATASAMAEAPAGRAHADESLESAVDAMLAADLDVMPVLSADGRLDGLLARDDLARVPGLVEVVAENRRRREELADAGAVRVTIGCGLASAALGLVLFALWVQGPANGLPRWVAWMDGFAAALAFVGAVTAFGREMIAVPVWAITGIGLCFAAGVAHAWSGGAWTTWVQLAFAVAFLLMAATLGTRWPRRRAGALRASA